MFVKLVQNLAFAPGIGSQLGFYVRRLRKESVTRKLSVIAGLGLMVFQIFASVAPPNPVNAASSNDVIFGGVKSRTDLLRVYDHGLPGHHSAKDIQAVFKHFGITRQDIGKMTGSNVISKDKKLHSLGRNPHFKEDRPVRIGGTTYYLRPLYLWDRINPFNKYAALKGRRSDGVTFWVMLNCGNLVFVGIPPAIKPPTPPPPKPPTPPPPPKPKPPTVSLVPNITIAKQAEYLTSGNDANNTTAKPGNVIVYSLLVKNTGNGDQANYVVEENINDILEYADVADPGGATLTGGNLVWPAETIGAGQLVIKKFRIKVKSPIPATPRSSSDPSAFDLRMDNVFGNRVSIEVPPPPVKQVEVASANLPRTGVGLNVTLVFVFVALSVYFYSRNRQLITEVNILRAEQSHGGGN